MKDSNKKQVIEIDLTKIDGDGDFPCPGCGAIISPEDETENVYTIIEEKIRNDILEQMIIHCNACETQICLTGFPNFDIDIPEPEENYGK